MIRIGRLTSSDRASAGIYEDLSGPAIEKALAAFFAGEEIEWRRVLKPDDRPALEAALRDLVDRERCRLVVTTGGTGPNRRDVTPEATRAALDLELPGFGEIMRMRTFDVAPTSILSRATAGIRRACLIINLPGRPSAIPECLDVLGPAIKKALELLEPEYLEE
ncbi:MAG TPA: molybdopterin adenylyltransferase [Candidatus Methylacidiphilales bacterium]|jgi:molybdopterin adenylyltransferase|nr:molybdopterin adenylyltransferase [Candidatus Methylacidiphilales bacterium]